MKLKPSTSRNAAPSAVIDVPAENGRVSPSDINLSDMAAQVAVAKAAKRGSTPPRVRTPDRAAGRISFASTKRSGAKQMSPPKIARSGDPSEDAEVHLATLTPLARSLATNVANARARSSSSPSAAVDGLSPEV